MEDFHSNFTLIHPSISASLFGGVEVGCARVVGGHFQGITGEEWPFAVQEWVEDSESGVPNVEP